MTYDLAEAAGRAVVDASVGAAAVFHDVGMVELKGVSGAMNLHAPSLPG